MDNETQTDLGCLWKSLPLGLFFTCILVWSVQPTSSQAELHSVEDFQCFSTLFYNFLFSLLSVTL